jgi:hypothetical protein
MHNNHCHWATAHLQLNIIIIIIIIIIIFSSLNLKKPTGAPDVQRMELLTTDVSGKN